MPFHLRVSGQAEILPAPFRRHGGEDVQGPCAEREGTDADDGAVRRLAIDAAAKDCPYTPGGRIRERRARVFSRQDDRKI